MPVLFSAVYRLLSFDGELILEELLDVAILGLNRLPARTLSQTLHFVVVCDKKQLFRIAVILWKSWVVSSFTVRHLGLECIVTMEKRCHNKTYDSAK